MTSILCLSNYWPLDDNDEFVCGRPHKKYIVLCTYPNVSDIWAWQALKVAFKDIYIGQKLRETVFLNGVDQLNFSGNSLLVPSIK